MNYTELKTSISSICENPFSDTELSLFVKQAEQKIYNSVQVSNLRKNTIGTTTAGNKYLSSPGDFLSVFSLAVVDPATGEYEYLLNKDVNFIRQSYPNPNDQGIPKYYAIFGPTTTNSNPPVLTNELSFILGPTPAAAYTVELHYFFYPVSIVDAGTSWLGDNFDPVLLYGTLIEAYTFMKGETDMVGLYDGKYKEAIALAKRLGDGLERQDAYRSGQYRAPVN